MKQVLLLALCASFLVGCFSDAKFDGSTKDAAFASAEEIGASLPLEKRERFNKAIGYFMLGGSDGIGMMFKSALSGDDAISPDEMIALNLKVIDGLTVDEIINLHSVRVLQDKENEEAKARRQLREEANSRVLETKRLQELEAIRTLEEKAEAALAKYKFAEAGQLYDKIGLLDAGSDVAVAGLAKVKEAAERFHEVNNYIERIEITKFEAKRIDTYLEKDVPAVRFGLKNHGERSLSKVKVVVFFKNSDGQTIFEEDFYPVNVGALSLSGENKPLKPGYIFELERGKYYTIESTLSEWQTGNAVAQIVDVEFSGN